MPDLRLPRSLLSLSDTTFGSALLQGDVELDEACYVAENRLREARYHRSPGLRHTVLLRFVKTDHRWNAWITDLLSANGFTLIHEDSGSSPDARVLAMDDPAAVPPVSLSFVSRASLRRAISRSLLCGYHYWAAPGTQHALVLLDDCELPSLATHHRTVRLANPTEKQAARQLVTLVTSLMQPNSLKNLWASLLPIRSASDTSFPLPRRAIARLPLGPANVEVRSGLMASMQSYLEPESASETANRAVLLYGPPGSGKTTLAVEYARRFSSEYDVVLFISRCDVPASTPLLLSELLQSRLADLQPSSFSDSPRHLIVLDDFDELFLRKVRTSLTTANIIATSRRQAGGPDHLVIEVGMFSSTESTRFLSRALGRQVGDGGQRLAALLGNLPLALSHAATYIRSFGLTFDEACTAIIASGLTNTPFTRFLVVFWEQLVTSLPDSTRRVLVELALLEDAIVPWALLDNRPSDDPVALPTGMTDGPLLPLVDRGIVSRRPGGVSLNPLFARLCEGQASLQDRRQAVTTLLARLHRLLDEHTSGPGARDAYENALPHILRLCKLAEELDVDRPLAALVLARLASYQFSRGTNDQAIALQRLAVARLRRCAQLRLITRDTLLLATADFVKMLAKAGDYTSAVKLAVRSSNGSTAGTTLAARARQLGEYAAVLFAAGELARAEDFQSRALELFEREPGQALSPSQLPGLSTILLTGAALHREMGRYPQAEELASKALRIRQQLYGYTGPEVSEALRELSSIRRSLGRLTEAAELLEQARAVTVGLLGKDHPDVASLLLCESASSLDAGNVKRARQCAKRALSAYESTYGPSHPEVIRATASLALACRDDGAYRDAREYAERATSLLFTGIGREHFRAADILAVSGSILRSVGEVDTACEMLRHALDLQRAYLPESHPDIARTLCELASGLMEGADLPAALKLLAEVDALRAELFSAHHPFWIEMNLVNARARAILGDAFSSIGFYKIALRICRDVYGATHYLTARALRRFLESLLDLNEGDDFDHMVDEIRVAERSLHYWHPERGTTKYLTARLQLATGRPEDAAKSIVDALIVQETALWSDHPDIRRSHLFLSQLSDVTDMAG